MTQRSSSTKPTKKPSSHRSVEADRVTDPDPLRDQPSQGADGENSRNRRIYLPPVLVAVLGKIFLSPVLLWFLGLAAGLVLIGSTLQDIALPFEAMQWLIYRRGFPYVQAITLSGLAVTASIVIPNTLRRLRNIDRIQSIAVLIVEPLLETTSGYRSNRFWTILFFFFIVSFFASLQFVTCLSSKAILVSFDILDGGSLVKKVSPGEILSYAPARYIEIEAKLEANLFNLPPPRVTCEWVTSTGDGRLIQATNCKINYQTGSDERPDPVVVRLTQNSCPSLGFRSFYVSKAEQ